MEISPDLHSAGSSPRAWGTQPTRRRWQRNKRFIPTCVGNTEPLGLIPVPPRFIPTCVGNTRKIKRSSREDGGSSPRAWGTPALTPFPLFGLRFIPTCVGNTPVAKGYIRSWRFIPTCVGNTTPPFISCIYLSGSSPRAWGTRYGHGQAGGRHSVHPHVRGEHSWFQVTSAPAMRFIPTCVGNTLVLQGGLAPLLGSSPRAWGTHLTHTGKSTT